MWATVASTDVVELEKLTALTWVNAREFRGKSVALKIVMNEQLLEEKS